jgi:hypothetical protein
MPFANNQNSMKQTHSTRPAHSSKAKASRTDFDQVIRQCESAALRVKTAGEELAACWTALGLEMSIGGSRTELLRRRAWCNVLELRLKEKAEQLEQARQALDEVWNEIMQISRGKEIAPRLKSFDENIFAQSWSLLLQPKTLAGEAVAAGK